MYISKFFQGLFICLGKEDLQTEGKIKYFCPLVHYLVTAIARTVLIQSQKPETFFRSPKRVWNPETLPTFHCFPKPHSGKWMGSGPLCTQTHTHRQRQHLQVKQWSVESSHWPCENFIINLMSAIKKECKKL